MRFTDTKIPGVVVVDCDVFPDERGLFAITWAAKDFAARPPHDLRARTAPRLGEGAALARRSCY